MEENKSESMRDKIDEKYKKLENELFMDVLRGKINSYDELHKRHRSLEYDYIFELRENCEEAEYLFASFNKPFRELLKEQEEKGKDIHDFIRRYVWTSDKVDDVFSKKVYSFIDEDGNVCDEYGNRLSEDGEHRVFEVVKGGKK